MALKKDIEQAFRDNLDTGGEIEDIAKLLTDVYKDAVNSGKDPIGNVATSVNFNAIEKAIAAQFRLSYNTRSYLAFNLIEAALVTAWSPATHKAFISPPPGMSTVIRVSVTSSVPPGTTPLVEASDGYTNVVNKFYDMFTKHAKSISFLYTGIATAGSPPPTITIPVSSYTIK